VGGKRGWGLTTAIVETSKGASPKNRKKQGGVDCDKGGGGRSGVIYNKLVKKRATQKLFYSRLFRRNGDASGEEEDGFNRPHWLRGL